MYWFLQIGSHIGGSSKLVVWQLLLFGEKITGSKNLWLID